MPGRVFIASCPTPVQAKLVAVLIAVAAAPPLRFSGGGFWEAMHDRMTGYHEIRVDARATTSLPVVLQVGHGSLRKDPLLTVLCGASKPFRTEFPEAVYDHVLDLGHEYLSRNPRSLV